MPYNLYSEKYRKMRWVHMDICKTFLKPKHHQQFEDNCEKLKIIDDEENVDILHYAHYYCLKDVEVLKLGYQQFRKDIFALCEDLEIEPLDINHYKTLARLANEILTKANCYTGVYKSSGVARAFLQKAVVGGRTMTCENQKQKQVAEGTKIADFDGVSLYPSSMSRIEGFVKGKPKVITNTSLEHCMSQDFFVADVKIKSVGKNLKFPLQSKVDEDKKVRYFRNDLEGEILRMDKTALQDFIKYQKADVEIIKGFYYDEGFNNTVNKVITKIFNQRLKYKKLGNPIQNVYKLVMNSSYGYSMLKPVETELKIVPKNEKENHMIKYFNYIKQMTPSDDKKTYRVEHYKSIEDHYNNVVCGIQILSMAKRIMNEVMVTAENENIMMYYTDTDSIHIDEDKLPILQKSYEEIYKRPLVGKQLGQFHTDFDLGDCNNVYSEGLIALGKKCYIDMLVGEKPDGTIERGYHVRMKGVSNGAILNCAKESELKLEEIYDGLYDGETYKFDLLKDEDGDPMPKFKFNKNYTIQNETDFIRTISF